MLNDMKSRITYSQENDMQFLISSYLCTALLLPKGNKKRLEIINIMAKEFLSVLMIIVMLSHIMNTPRLLRAQWSHGDRVVIVALSAEMLRLKPCFSA